MLSFRNIILFLGSSFEYFLFLNYFSFYIIWILFHLETCPCKYLLLNVFISSSEAGFSFFLWFIHILNSFSFFLTDAKIYWEWGSYFLTFYLYVAVHVYQRKKNTWWTYQLKQGTTEEIRIEIALTLNILAKSVKLEYTFKGS